ncbi:RepB family plasmid replication initiator protein [Leuconostoc falkenbergense]|uniref:RepB family plasmid replication initiator protein n=1 Tax=Leuconostoc falkenbergense TaxID=2766470 RepID=UPI003BB0BC23
MSSITKNEWISHMNDIKDRKVAQHNDLITSVAKMDKMPLKIFELSVSCIDTDNPPKDNVIYLSKKELFTFFDVTDTNKHSRFKEAIEKMQKQAYFQIKENKDLGIEYESIVPIPTVRWNDYNDEVFVRFNPDIMPYLIDLRKNFTQYAITDIIDLESKYSIILYKWLCMNFNQFETYQFKNNRTQKQLEEYKNPQISIKNLRIMTDTLKEYPRFDNFESYILKNSLKEITKYTHFNVTYDKIKKGRSITDIQFHIEKKVHWKDEEYKRDDEVAKLSIEQQQQQNDILFAKGIASPYTIKLLTANLITGLDMASQGTIIGLSKHVYPLYDELVKLNGEMALMEHLGYVSDKMVDYTSSKKNIVKYLQISALQYLDDGIGIVVEENKQQIAEQKKKQRMEVKKAPEWSNTNYVETTTDEEKSKFSELQKKMRDNIKI